MLEKIKCFVYKDKIRVVFKQQLALSTTYSARTKSNNSKVATPTIIAAVDSGASDNYFPASFKG